MQNPDKQLELWRTWIILLFLPFIFWLIPGLVFTAIAIYLLNRELKKSWYSLKDLFWEDWSNNRTIFLKDIKKRYNIKTYTYEKDSPKDKIDKDTEETHETIYWIKKTNESTNDLHSNWGKRITTIGITTLIIILLPLIVFWLITINNLGMNLTPIFLFLLLMIIIKYPKTMGTIVWIISLIYIVFFLYQSMKTIQN